MPPFAVTKLDHVSVLITDLRALPAFYRDIVGLKPITSRGTFASRFFGSIWAINICTAC